MGYCSESQAGFRKGRATRDNIYILTALIDFCLERQKAQAVVTNVNPLCENSGKPTNDAERARPTNGPMTRARTAAATDAPVQPSGLLLDFVDSDSEGMCARKHYVLRLQGPSYNAVLTTNLQLTTTYLELRLEVDAVEPALLVAQDAPHAATVDREVKAEPTGRGYGQRQS